MVFAEVKVLSKGMMVELEKQVHLQKVVGAKSLGLGDVSFGRVDGMDLQAASATERYERNNSKYCHRCLAIVITSRPPSINLK